MSSMSRVSVSTVDSNANAGFRSAFVDGVSLLTEGSSALVVHEADGRESRYDTARQRTEKSDGFRKIKANGERLSPICSRRFPYIMLELSSLRI